jgi:hypothetical protein
MEEGVGEAEGAKPADAVPTGAETLTPLETEAPEAFGVTADADGNGAAAAIG